MTDRVIIEKADGSTASVVESEFKKHYPDVAYKVLGDETDNAFIADVPRAATRAGARRKSRKTVRPAKPADAPAEETQP